MTDIRERHIAPIFRCPGPDSFHTTDDMRERVIIDRNLSPVRVAFTVNGETLDLSPGAARAMANALNGVADIADEAAGRRAGVYAHRHGFEALQQTSPRP